MVDMIPTANHQPFVLLLLSSSLTTSSSPFSSHITLDDSRVSGTHPATCTCLIFSFF